MKPKLLTKWCSKCKTEKVVSQFYRANSRGDGLTGWCKVCHNAGCGNWGKQHYEYCKQKSREWSIRNPERVRVSQRRWVDNNRERVRYLQTQWRIRNAGKAKETARRSSQKVRSSVMGRLNALMYNGIWRASRKGQPGLFWEKLVGYTFLDFKKHFEKGFLPGMTWSLFLLGKIHLHHKVPVSFFHFKCALDWEFQYCWSLDNLQPMWAETHRKLPKKKYSEKA